MYILFWFKFVGPLFLYTTPIFSCSVFLLCTDWHSCLCFSLRGLHNVSSFFGYSFSTSPWLGGHVFCGKKNCFSYSYIQFYKRKRGLLRLGVQSPNMGARTLIGRGPSPHVRLDVQGALFIENWPILNSIHLLETRVKIKREYWEWLQIFYKQNRETLDWVDHNWLNGKMFFFHIMDVGITFESLKELN